MSSVNRLTSPRIETDRCSKVAESVKAFHDRGRVHGAVALPNVFVGRTESRHRLIFLGDCGNGRRSKWPGWTAPEVYDGEPARTASDIYGLGLLLLVLWSGLDLRDRAFTIISDLGEDTREADMMADELAAMGPSRLWFQEKAELFEDADHSKLIRSFINQMCAPDPADRPTVDRFIQFAGHLLALCDTPDYVDFNPGWGFLRGPPM